MSTVTAPLFWCTTIGKKYLMALSGLIWGGFVFGHMAGNMLMFYSADAYNAYGHALTSGMLIYVVEAALITTLAGHVLVGLMLTWQNWGARGSRYAASSKSAKAASLSSRTMIIQGSLILAFIVLHIGTFKFGTYYETTVNGVVMRDLHRLIVEVFQQPGYVIWYLVALVLLGVHLSHGMSSTVQSLGVLSHGNGRWIKTAGWIYAVVVAGGFISQPIYVYFFHS